MVKRTLFFGNPAYLNTKNEQLVVNFPDEDKPPVSIPIEDLGYIVLEHPQITLTNGLICKLIENKTAIITCDKQHLPNALLQPLTGHSEQTERFRHQLNSSVPLKKNLWQQTISAKIGNQALHLSARDKDSRKLMRWADEVKSGDTENHEAIAAALYFQSLFNHVDGFSRNQKDVAPNGLLNYGYAILRAVTARALISTGLLPSVGIFHSNKYNSFCLADDIMEPYRIYVDALVYNITQRAESYENLTQQLKAELLTIPAMDVIIEGKRSPLMVAMSRTTNSLYECYAGISRKVLYPVFEIAV
jgi:CRISPR-associated protein Cas1